MISMIRIMRGMVNGGSGAFPSSAFVVFCADWLCRGIQQTTILAKQLKDIGIDLIDVSSGGNYAGQKIPVGPGYQVPFAAHIKKEVPGLTVSIHSLPCITIADPSP